MRCQNPTCGKEIQFDEMQVGHKTAWSRGGPSTLKNSVCLCYRCNKLQGTDSWAVFMKKQGVVVVDPKDKIRQSLKALTVPQLKSLAAKYNVKVAPQVIEKLFTTERRAPTKQQYVNKLVRVVSTDDLSGVREQTIQPTKK